MRFTALSLAAGLLSAAAVSSIATISTKGSYFFTSDGDRWFVKGVAYQLSNSDPLADEAQCKLDAALMTELGANAIRVYHVDSDEDHSGCMSVFEDAGIYLFVDLDTYSTEITQEEPSWNSTQMSYFEAVMDDFQQYDNTAGFFIGNEVINNASFSYAAAYVKSATAYMKAYRTSKGYRTIPIGYSHADVSTLRPNLQNYFACGSNSSENLEFFGLNTYEWCGSNTYEGSGYETLTQEVLNYSIPIFMSETGCNTPEPRLFQDQAAIFGSDMSPYWSGAIVYEWIQETNHYGLITYGGETDALITSVEAATAVVRSGTPTPVSPDFSNLLSAWSSATPTSISESAYTSTNTAGTCPAYTANTWEIDGNIALPTLNEVFDDAVLASITGGSAATTTSGSVSGSATAASTSATSTGAAARAYPTGSKELLGVSAGLGGVMLGVVYWL